MMTLILDTLEAAINQYLRLDPDTLARIAKLQGKTIQLDITDWQVQCVIIPQVGGIQLEKKMAAPPDTVIRGKLFALTRAGLAQGDTRAFFENQIEITGDTQVGQAMQDILKKIDIDWEEHLSRVIGDAPAYQAMSGLRRVKAFFESSRKNLAEKLSDYLHQEARCFPTRNEMENFRQDVNALRNAVDRAEARLKQCK